MSVKPPQESGREWSYSWVEHVTSEEDARNLNDVVGSTSNTGCERSETDGRGLSDNDPRGGCRTQGEQDGDNETQGRLRQSSCVRLAARGCNTESNEQDSITSRTPEVDGTAAKVSSEDPRKHDEDHLECRGDKTHGECSIVSHSSLCALC